jgi:maleamate amidohydrolase
MIISQQSARSIYEDYRNGSSVVRIGVGQKAAVIGVDTQRRYTDKASFPTAYETNPRQLDYINALAATCRRKGFPIVWTYVAYDEDGIDCGLWGERSKSALALRNVHHGSAMAELDPRLTIAPTDKRMHKRMASAFFETNLLSSLIFQAVDTVFVVGGATSGCVRATVVDAMSYGIKVVVPEECVADRHESSHFSSLYDMATKYADVVPVEEAIRLVETMTIKKETEHGA